MLTSRAKAVGLAGVLLYGGGCTMPAMPPSIRSARVPDTPGWSGGGSIGTMQYRSSEEYVTRRGPGAPAYSLITDSTDEYKSRQRGLVLVGEARRAFDEHWDIGLETISVFFLTASVRFQLLGTGNQRSIASAVVLEAGSTLGGANMDGGVVWCWTFPVAAKGDLTIGGRYAAPWRHAPMELMEGSPHEMLNVKYVDAFAGTEWTIAPNLRPSLGFTVRWPQSHEFRWINNDSGYSLSVRRWTGPVAYVTLALHFD